VAAEAREVFLPADDDEPVAGEQPFGGLGRTTSESPAMCNWVF